MLYGSIFGHHNDLRWPAMEEVRLWLRKLEGAEDSISLDMIEPRTDSGVSFIWLRCTSHIQCLFRTNPTPLNGSAVGSYPVHRESRSLVQVLPTSIKHFVLLESVTWYQTCLASIRHWFLHRLAYASHCVREIDTQIAGMISRRTRMRGAPRTGND